MTPPGRRSAMRRSGRPGRWTMSARERNVGRLSGRGCRHPRRRQRVIAHAPGPGMAAATREALCDAAVRAARAVDYVGAGTTEFIAEGSEGLRAGRIWLMEMNTRL